MSLDVWRGFWGKWSWMSRGGRHQKGRKKFWHWVCAAGKIILSATPEYYVSCSDCMTWCPWRCPWRSPFPPVRCHVTSCSNSDFSRILSRSKAGEKRERKKEKSTFLLKHIKGEKERYLLWQNTTCEFSGDTLLSSYKTTVKQQLNGEKWDVGCYSAFGWAALLRSFCVQCLEECWHDNDA